MNEAIGESQAWSACFGIDNMSIFFLNFQMIFFNGKEYSLSILPLERINLTKVMAGTSWLLGTTLQIYTYSYR